MTTTAAATSTYLDAGYLTRSTRATSTDAGSSIDAGYLDARYLVAARFCRGVRAQVEGQDNGGGCYDDDNGCGDVDLA